MKNETQQLIESYLDGKAGADEISKLDELVKGDGDVRRDLILSSALEDHIRDILLTKAENVENAAFADERGHSPSGKIKKAAWLAIPFGIAAAAAIIVNLPMHITGPGGTAAVAPSNMQAVPPGVDVEASEVKIDHHCKDGSVLALAPASKMTIVEETELSTVVFLQSGEVEANVTDRKTNGRAVFMTEHLSVDVVGTILKVGTSNKGSWVEVVEGRVEVRKKGDSYGIYVDAGEYAFIRAAEPGGLQKTTKPDETTQTRPPGS